ncbi:hypothetical protein WOLCODRAFT_138840 [Wolfiporia cocos MD-104 SS10]|uniref:Uncharacterized protein n=1 Tax=Wolfiporia cocos (strain MD-104) TaxID=742152 RepID=A0A2H3JPY2_WOLCO|nr:hypothetical protein WOLCODRAFT_138840 [Wolfiporia cocos MD-104 SS10]
MHPWSHHWMHPYPREHWRHFHFRGHRSSRLVWFLIGAASASFYFKAHERHAWKAHRCLSDRLPPPAAPAESGAAAQGKDTVVVQGNGWSWGSHSGCRSVRHPVPEPEQQAQPAPVPHIPPPPMPSDRWEEDHLRVHALGKQAGNTISELSEATLDSVLSTVQSLKAKLAETRAQHERQVAAEEALKSEQFKLFEEWQKEQEEKKKAGASKPRHLV